jgi:hypothetical protein
VSFPEAFLAQLADYGAVRATYDEPSRLSKSSGTDPPKLGKASTGEPPATKLNKSSSETPKYKSSNVEPQLNKSSSVDPPKLNKSSNVEPQLNKSNNGESPTTKLGKSSVEALKAGKTSPVIVDTPTPGPRLGKSMENLRLDKLPTSEAPPTKLGNTSNSDNARFGKSSTEGPLKLTLESPRDKPTIVDSPRGDKKVASQSM